MIRTGIIHSRSPTLNNELVGCHYMKRQPLVEMFDNIVTWTAQRSLNNPLRGDVTVETAVAVKQ
jgi:hypothetical protein